MTVKIKIVMALTITLAFCFDLLAQGSDRVNKMTIPEYISAYYKLAQSEMHRMGIPASITLAQGILESSFGNSRLALKANNHFGIKCGGNWTGKTMLEDDDEKGECFRRYNSVLHSFIDHSNFLVNSERYAFLFQLKPTDYKGWARGLQKAGYATNPNYANLLIRLIEDRNLHQYDTQNKSLALSTDEEEYIKSFDNQYFVFNGIKTVISQPNELPLDLAYKYDISLKQLLRYNDLEETEIIPPGSKIYLQPKKRKGDEKYHKVEDGETIRSISQKHGIRMNSIYKKNLMEIGQEPAVGEILCLVKKCEAAPKLKTDEDLKKDIQQQITKKVEKATEEELKATRLPEPVKEEPKESAVVNTLAEEKAVIEAEPLPRQTIPVEKIMEEEPPVEYMEEEEEIEEPVKEEAWSPIYHIVAPQETLYGISKMYAASVDNLKTWNSLTANTLEIGQKLVVGFSAGTESNVAANHNRETKPDSFFYHTVEPKETLYGISRKYGMALSEIKLLNNLTSNELKIGQVLKIKY